MLTAFQKSSFEQEVIIIEKVELIRGRIVNQNRAGLRYCILLDQREQKQFEDF